MSANTLLLRMEGPLQAWGDHNSKFIVRRTAEAPTKSGVIGLLCAALGVSRPAASEQWLPRLNELEMGVRIDRPGVRWWDYHTVGAGYGLPTAGRLKAPSMRELALLSLREYLCDASFLVALRGAAELIAQLAEALRRPRWNLYLGRKSCPPSRPILEQEPAEFSDLLAALSSAPWRPRHNEDPVPPKLLCLLEWRPGQNGEKAPAHAEVWYDTPRSFQPPAHDPRFVVRRLLEVAPSGDVTVGKQVLPPPAPPPSRPRADYTNSQYRARARQRLREDHSLCVFCKSPATTVHHVTYRRAGGEEDVNDLRSLCQLCHDAATMAEYGLSLGLDRIDPEDPRWRPFLLAQVKAILAHRSLEKRRRFLREAP